MAAQKKPAFVNALVHITRAVGLDMKLGDCIACVGAEGPSVSCYAVMLAQRQEQWQRQREATE